MPGKRGFASMTPERRREIASMGGKAAPADKRSFFLNRELAAQAGRKGGTAVKPEDRAFYRDRKFAADCGRKGGKTPSSKRRIP